MRRQKTAAWQILVVTLALTASIKVAAQSAVKTVTGTEESRVSIEVPSTQQEKIGLKTAAVVRSDVEHVIRTIGLVTFDERKEAHVHTRINGWIEEIFVNYVGQPVKQNEPLFSLYSPELVSTQEEFLAAKRAQGVGGELAKTALERLRLWGLSDREIERLKQTRKAERALVFRSPIDGFVVEKTAIQGLYVTPQMHLYHIADLSRVWLIITLYEYDLPLVEVGDQTEVGLTYQPERKFEGKITYIYPEVDVATRTAKARIEVQNEDLALKPGMYANVQIRKDLGPTLMVPEEAVIDTGVRKIVFVRQDGQHFEPREVETRSRIEHSYPIVKGLNEGEEVVVSAQFLIDAESKLQAALARGETLGGGHGGHGGHGQEHKDAKSNGRQSGADASVGHKH